MFLGGPRAGLPVVDGAVLFGVADEFCEHVSEWGVGFDFVAVAEHDEALFGAGGGDVGSVCVPGESHAACFGVDGAEDDGVAFAALEAVDG